MDLADVASGPRSELVLDVLGGVKYRQRHVDLTERPGTLMLFNPDDREPYLRHVAR